MKSLILRPLHVVTSYKKLTLCQTWVLLSVIVSSKYVDNEYCHCYYASCFCGTICVGNLSSFYTQ